MTQYRAGDRHPRIPGKTVETAAFPAWYRSLDSSDGLNGWQLAAILLAALVLVLLRRPSDVLHAQFWAEDGTLWFAQAYNDGWTHALFRTNVGYIDVVPRLAASAALAVPMRDAPLVMNLAGALVQALPVSALLSRRARTWGPLSTRVFMAVLYVLLPNTKEIQVTATNAPWHLAVLALIVGMYEPPESWIERGTDVLVVCLAATSGPYALVVAPVLLAYWVIRRLPWTLILSGVCVCGAAVQVYSLLFIGRAAPGLGATAPLFIRLVGGECFLDALFGANGVVRHLPIFVPFLGLLLGICILFFANRVAPLPMRLFTVYCLVMLGLSLRKPLGASHKMWEALAAGGGDRYWFFPTLAFAWSLIWCFEFARQKPVRRLAAGALCLMPIGLLHNFHYQSYPDLRYAASVTAFEEAPRGQWVHIPIPPDWLMDLRRH